VFDQVHLAGAAPAGRWTGLDVGADSAAAPAAPPRYQGYHQARGTFTVTGSGDIAPLVAGPGAGVPTATISDHLVGAFAGLLVIVVIAAMFMTAEYRRGLIRTTLAATPRRGQVLAAKALVIGSAAFAAGLVAAVIAVTAGVRLSRDSGSYLLPVPWLTEVRVVAGTAALLAVAAVLALAIGTLLRRGVAAITVVIAGLVLPYILATASVLPSGAAEWLLRVTPAAAFAIQQSVPQYSQVTAAYPPVAGYYPLAPWAGFSVLCAFTVLALALAARRLHRRDA
jgi:ABC-type transport system involved in multi-copper enzyme maturation permease subunit